MCWRGRWWEKCCRKGQLGVFTAGRWLSLGKRRCRPPPWQHERHLIMPTSKLITMATATGSDDITNNTAAPKPFRATAPTSQGPKSESLPPPISWQPPLLIALIKITIIWPAQSAIDGVGNSRFAFLSADVLLLPLTFQFGRPCVRLFLARERRPLDGVGLFFFFKKYWNSTF